MAGGSAGRAGEKFFRFFEKGEPSATTFLLDAKVGGTCVAVADITINDPNYYSLRGDAEAIYYISGETEVTLAGDIQ